VAGILLVGGGVLDLEDFSPLELQIEMEERRRKWEENRECPNYTKEKEKLSKRKRKTFTH
jgi:hypothetical protein